MGEVSTNAAALQAQAAAAAAQAQQAAAAAAAAQQQAEAAQAAADAAAAQAAAEAAPATAPMAGDSASVTAADGAVPTGEMAEAPQVGPLRAGDEGPAVSRLQRHLNRAGADPQLEVTGTFGPETEAAVRQAQQREGLAVNGVATREFREAIAPPPPTTGDHPQLREALRDRPEAGAFVDPATGEVDIGQLQRANDKAERLEERIENMPEGAKRERFESKLRDFRAAITTAADRASEIGDQVQQFNSLLATDTRAMSSEERAEHFEQMAQILDGLEADSPALHQALYDRVDRRFGEALSDGELTDNDIAVVRAMEESGFDMRKLSTETLTGMMGAALGRRDGNSLDNEWGPAEVLQTAYLGLMAQPGRDRVSIGEDLVAMAPRGSDERRRLVGWLSDAPGGAREYNHDVNPLSMLPPGVIDELKVGLGNDDHHQQERLFTAEQQARERIAARRAGAPAAREDAGTPAQT